jgi:hypothetical protein
MQVRARPHDRSSLALFFCGSGSIFGKQNPSKTTAVLIGSTSCYYAFGCLNMHDHVDNISSNKNCRHNHCVLASPLLIFCSFFINSEWL